MPTLNEEKGVGKTIESIQQQKFKENNWELNIAIIDGLSKDNTRKTAQQHGADVILEKRKGYGRAYKTGMQQTDADIIVTGDADTTYPFNEIHTYIQQLLDEDLDFITTNRFAQLTHGAMSVKHAFGNIVLALVLRILFFINIKDSQSGMWIFKTQALKKLPPLEEFNDGMAFSEEIKIEMFRTKNIKAKEIPSTLYPRQGEVKLESFKDGYKNLKFLFKKRITPHYKHPTYTK
ncbi:MAG: glycosyltransferase family 2 protein [Thermoplasmatota archaeon]